MVPLDSGYSQVRLNFVSVQGVLVETYIVVSSSMKASLQSLQGKEKKFFVPFGREIYSENVEESLESNFHCIDNFNQKKTGIQL